MPPRSPNQPQYDPNDKVLLYARLQLRPEVRRSARADESLDVGQTIEQFTIGFADMKPDAGVLYMAWDRTVGSIDFTLRK